MRVVVALGGNALLRRGEPPTAQAQRCNARAAARAIAPLAGEHELVVSYGSGPEIGLLGLPSAAHSRVETSPLDILGAEAEGMIGYVLQQELGNEQLAPRPIVTVLTQIEVDPEDPAFDRPSKLIGPLYTVEEAERLKASRDWAFKSDGDHMRRAVPSPRPRRIFGLESVRWLLKRGAVVVCSGGIAVAYTDEQVPSGRRLVGVEAAIDKDLASALLASEIHADMLAIITDVDAVYADWGTSRQRPLHLTHPAELAACRFEAGSMAPKVLAACSFVRRTGRPAVIGSIDDAAALIAGEAGTIVASEETSVGLHR